MWITARRAHDAGHDGYVVDKRTETTTFRGGVNIDLGRRYYGLKRVRATYPLGRLTVAHEEASLWVNRFGGLPRSLPLPLFLTPNAVCISVSHALPG